MARPKSSKVFVKNDGELKALMWATVAADNSVMMGFPWSSTEYIEMVMDKDLGNLRNEEIFSAKYAGSSKINFHASGRYKLSCKVGVAETALDRATVVGPPIAEISKPLRMAEILIPKDIPNSEYKPTPRDIVIDISGSPTELTRCTIGCMCNAEFEKLKAMAGPMVDTSEWEAWNTLATETHTWIWVLRSSRNDSFRPSKFYVTLLGNPKWGSAREAY